MTMFTSLKALLFSSVAARISGVGDGGKAAAASGDAPDFASLLDQAAGTMIVQAVPVPAAPVPVAPISVAPETPVAAAAVFPASIGTPGGRRPSLPDPIPAPIAHALPWAADGAPDPVVSPSPQLPGLTIMAAPQDAVQPEAPSVQPEAPLDPEMPPPGRDLPRHVATLDHASPLDGVPVPRFGPLAPAEPDADFNGGQDVDGGWDVDGEAEGEDSLPVAPVPAGLAHIDTGFLPMPVPMPVPMLAPPSLLQAGPEYSPPEHASIVQVPIVTSAPAPWAAPVEPAVGAKPVSPPLQQDLIPDADAGQRRLAAVPQPLASVGVAPTDPAVAPTRAMSIAPLAAGEAVTVRPVVQQAPLPRPMAPALDDRIVVAAAPVSQVLGASSPPDLPSVLPPVFWGATGAVVEPVKPGGPVPVPSAQVAPVQPDADFIVPTPVPAVQGEPLSPSVPAPAAGLALEPKSADAPLVSFDAIVRPERPAASSSVVPMPIPVPVPVPVDRSMAAVTIAEMPVADTQPEEAAIRPTEKAQALPLLQLVRDQMMRRSANAVGDAVGDAAGEREWAAASPRATVDPTTPPIRPESAAPPLQVGPLQVGPHHIAAVPPPSDLSASLGAQVVDMGVAGQWIDGLARDIAGLSAHGAQGRFQITADRLGPVQVDIRQGTDGATVSLTVATEGAETALRQDSDRLRLDAGLAALRISEVKIERASAVPEPGRSETGNAPSGQPASHSPSGSQGSGQTAGQAMAQFQGQSQGRWQARENLGTPHKNTGDPAVLNHADAADRAGDGVRARYA